LALKLPERGAGGSACRGGAAEADAARDRQTLQQKNNNMKDEPAIPIKRDLNPITVSLRKKQIWKKFCIFLICTENFQKTVP
jgi:hypothetical protein